MPFPSKERSFQIEAQGGICQTMVYKESTGWHPCGSTDHLEVDHLFPESGLIYSGELDPNTSPAIVRCKKHHTGQGMTRDEDNAGYGRLASYGEPEWSRHPDMYNALLQYREGDKDAFRKCAAQHRVEASHGIRITNDDLGVTLYERNRVRDMVQEFVTMTGEQAPHTKPHKAFVRKSWTDIYMGTRSYPQDEE